MYTAIRKIIEAAWENRELLKKEETRSAIDQVIGLLDKGKLRTATPTDEGWQVNEWVKKAVILYFPTQPMSTMTTGPFEYHDKIRLKQDYAELGVRVVPPAAARYGAYVAYRSGTAVLDNHLFLSRIQNFTFRQMLGCGTSCQQQYARHIYYQSFHIILQFASSFS